MKRDIVWKAQFKKDYKLACKRNLDIELLDNIIRALSKGEKLDDKYRDHDLSKIGQGIASVTFSQTSFWFAESRMTF